jgi:hypothetical protein
MDEDAAEGRLINLRGVDMANLLTGAAGAGMKAALERLPISNADGYNAFNNSIN